LAKSILLRPSKYFLLAEKLEKIKFELEKNIQPVLNSIFFPSLSHLTFQTGELEKSSSDRGIGMRDFPSKDFINKFYYPIRND
jgi:hypothetical protein